LHWFEIRAESKEYLGVFVRWLAIHLEDLFAWELPLSTSRLQKVQGEMFTFGKAAGKIGELIA
jgi:hypothetical protein